MKKRLSCLLPFLLLNLATVGTVVSSSIESNAPVVTLLQSSEKALLTFSLLKANNSNLPGDISLTGAAKSYNVIML